MRDKVKVIYVNSGLASTIKDSHGNEYIEVNKALNDYPALKRYVMQHELKHIRASFRKDLLNDVESSFNAFLFTEFIKFYFTHLSAWRQLLPLDLRKMKTKREEYMEVRVNWFMIFFWVILGVIIYLGFTL